MPDLETLFTPLRQAPVPPEPIEVLQRRVSRRRRRRRAVRGGLLLGVTGLVVVLASTAGGDRGDKVDVSGRGRGASATTASTAVTRSVLGNHPDGGESSPHGLPGLVVEGTTGPVRAQAGSSCWQTGTSGICVDAVLPPGRGTPTLNVHRGERLALRFDGSNVPDSVEALEYETNQKVRVEPGEPAHLTANLSAGVHDMIVRARFRQGSVGWYIRLRVA